ncbi:MAG: beta strand repeat-containing protein [Casimicrobiaceae bacterium]
MNLPRIRQFAYLACAVCSASVFAAVGVNKSFAPNSVVAGQPSTLTVVLLNPNASAATAVALTDTLPAGVVVANPLNVGGNSCGFTVSATPGARPIAFSAGTIPPISGGVAGQCQVTVDVVSAAPNTYLNTIPAHAVSSSQGTNAQDAQATLVVSKPANVTASKAFAPANVHGGGSASTLTITLTNPNPIALTNAALTDSLPAAITIAGTPNAATTCGTGTATPSSSAANPATITLSGGTIPANGSCTMIVDVVARNPNALTNGNQANTIAVGALTTTEGATNPAVSANINVQAGGQVTKAFAPTPIAPNGASNLTITVTNFNSIKLEPIAFTDTLPATITATALPASSCGGTISTVPAQPAPPPYTAFALAAGTLAGVVGPGQGSTTCTVTVPVTATATGNNTIAATSYGGVTIAAASGTLSVSAITGSKSFTTPALQTGSTTMTITLNNLTAAAATIATLRDDLTTMGAGFTVQSGAIPAGTCGVTLTSPAPGTLITTTGGAISANGSCTIVLPLDISATSATGNRTNTIAVANNATNGVHTTAGNNAVTITGVVNVQRALTVTKAFNPASVQGGAISRLTVTLAPTVALTGAGFIDDLTTMGAGFALLATGVGPNAVATNCGGGTVTANPGATSFSLAGASLTPGLNCTVAVNVATPAMAGTFTDRITAANITTAQGVTTSDVTANLALVSTAVTVNKSFSPTTIAVGAPNFSTLSIQIRNNNAGAIGLTGVGITDFFPLGMAIFTTPSASFSGAGCSGATISAPAGATQISLSGANVNANSICTLSVRVVANIAGNLIDTIPAAAIVSVQGISNALQGTATLAATGTVNLTISKSDGVTTVVPGTATTYTIGVSNAGPGDVTGLGMNDSEPAGMSFTSWTCAASAGSACPAGGSGSIAASVTVLHGGSLSFTVNAAIAPGATGSITNTASLAVPGSVIDTNPVTSASDTDTLTPQVTLAVVKTDGSASYTPGGTAVYVITVTSAGASDAEDVTVSDALPPGVTLTASASCVANGVAACGAVTGGIGQTSFGATGAQIGTGSSNSLVFTAPVAFAANMTANPMVNTATATDVATGAVASGADSDALAPQVTLSVVKSDGSMTYTPGGAATYTVTLSDGGLSDANDVTLADPLPAGVTLAADVTCVASGSASCGSVSGTSGQTTFGATGARIGAGAGNALVFTAPVSFTAGMATDPLDNTATATDLDSGASGAGTDSDALARQVSLAVSKTDGSMTYTPGGTASYTITVANTGLSDAIDVTVSDLLPAGVTLGGDATCIPVGSANCGTLAGSTGQSSFGATGASIGAGAGNSLLFTAPARFASDLADDPLINAATATDVASGASGSGSDSDARAAQAALGVSKADGTTTYTPGGGATYVIVVTNAGPSDASNTSVSDALPVGVSLAADASCTAAGDASCGTVTGTTGQTSFGTTGARIAAGAANTLTFIAEVTFAPTLTANPLQNIVTASDPALALPATAVDSDTRTVVVDLAITKTDGVTTAVPGQSVIYKIVVSNAGPSDAVGATVNDTLPAEIGVATWTCVASAGSCTASGSGNIADMVDVPAGATLTYTVLASIASGAAGGLANTASVAPAAGVTDSNPANNSATDNDVLVPTADLAIVKSDGSASYAPGAAVTYTIVATNAGPSAVTGAAVRDTLPAAITSAAWTCSGTGGGTCPASGSGNIDAVVDLPAGGSVTFVVIGTVLPATTGDLANTATVTAPAGTTDPNPGNNSATDSDAPARRVTLLLTKTDGSATYTPGGTATYTITVANAGPSDATAVTVTDNLPPGMVLGGGATCVASGSASCGGVAGGAGGTVFSATGATIAAGATNGLTITLPVAFSSSATATLVNTVTATDPDSASVASASDSDVPSVRLATAVPVDARWALVLLAVVLLLAAQRALRARPPRVGRR